VAAVAQGTTVTWAGVALGELLSVSVDGIASDIIEITPRTSLVRSKVYRPGDIDLGSISATCRGTAAATTTCVGQTGTLTISGPSVSWSASVAIYERLAWKATVGELQEYSITFKVSG
jgi:hypothetical protein